MVFIHNTMFSSYLATIMLLFGGVVEGSSHTMDNILDFYKDAENDGLNIIWAHAVNSKAYLEDSCNDDTMMLETDIILRGIGTENQTNIPVHAHPPDTDSDITLVEWLDRATQEPDKGMKLDFKYIEAVEPSMMIIKDKEMQLHTPLWVNADIVRGPNSPKDPIPPREFIQQCNNYFPLTTMSLGFTTFWNESASEDLYTWQMIFDNLQYTYPLEQPVTFPIRAIWCVRSWSKFTWLLGLKEDFSITVWSGSNDIVDVSGLIHLRLNGDTKRIYYDLPDPLMQEFKAALEDVVQPTPRTLIWDSELWETVPSIEENDFVFMSSESVGIMGGVVADSNVGWVKSKDQYKLSKDKDMEISGNVQFVDKYESCSGVTAINIAFRTGEIKGRGVSDGIVASVGNDGSVSLRDYNSNTVAAASLPASECYHIKIIDSAKNNSCELRVEIVRCADANIDPPNKGLAVDVKLGEIPGHENYDQFYVMFGKMGCSKDIVVEEFHVNSAGVVGINLILMFILSVFANLLPLF